MARKGTSPTYVTDLPMWSSRGATLSYVLFGPETTRVRLPEATTLPLPLTGAARKSTPASVQAARIASEDSIETVEQSTTAPGRCLRVGQQAALAEQDLLQVSRGGDHREHHVAVPEAGDRVGHRAALGRERLGLGPGAVPDGGLDARPGQPDGHGGTHPPRPDPPDREVRIAHVVALLQTIARPMFGTVLRCVKAPTL